MRQLTNTNLQSAGAAGSKRAAPTEIASGTPTTRSLQILEAFVQRSRICPPGLNSFAFTLNYVLSGCRTAGREKGKTHCSSGNRNRLVTRFLSNICMPVCCKGLQEECLLAACQKVNLPVIHALSECVDNGKHEWSSICFVHTVTVSWFNPLP